MIENVSKLKINDLKKSFKQNKQIIDITLNFGIVSTGSIF